MPKNCSKTGEPASPPKLLTRDMHALQRHPQRLRHHLRNLGVEPLPHLHATMGEQHGAVSVDVDEGASLWGWGRGSDFVPMRVRV